MTRKPINGRLHEWLLKCISIPLLVIAPYLRANYLLKGDIFTYKRLFRQSVSVRIDEFDEIGVETTDQGPFIEDVFWILKFGNTRMRIGDPHPVFRESIERFGSLKGFDWQHH
jgi:hypothetical protein